jgi:hypothetical protein
MQHFEKLKFLLMEVNVKQLSLRAIFLICGFLGAFCFSALAQEATIVGTVMDPSGAAVPNAAITVTNTDTGVVLHISSSGAGEYIAPDIHIGHYVVRAEATGFKAAERTDIVLQVGDRARVDFTMNLGTAQQSITVESSPIVVQSETGQQSNVITGQEVTQLATNGRSVYTLATLVPGASNTMGDDQGLTSTAGNDQVSFNGLRMSHNIYLVDGAEAYDRGSGGAIQIVPSLDAIAEFNVMTSNYGADYGLSSAGTMSIIFRSGTKQIHASAWEFNRNDAFDAASYTANASHAKTPELRLNEFGFNVGGPVVFPGYNKNRNKTFFFYNMEWRREIQGGSIDQTVPPTSEYKGLGLTANVPSAKILPAAAVAALAAGGTGIPANLTALAKAIKAGNLIQGSPFPSAYPLSNYLDPNAQLLLNQGIFPGNNTTSGGSPAYYGGANVPTQVREELVRIDEHFNDKVSIFGHYVNDKEYQGSSTTLWSDDNVPTIGTIFNNPSYSGTIHLMHTISPTLLNEIAYNQGGNSILFTPVGIYTQPSGLSIPRFFNLVPNVDTRNPGISISGVANYDVSEVPWVNVANDYQIRDDLSWVKGAHQLKFGGSWALYSKAQQLFGNTQGEDSFNGAFTGNSFADYLLGMSSGYSEIALQDSGHWPNTSWAFYVQDNWRATRRLTLNLGLRWDGIPHCTEKNGRDSDFYPNLWNPANAAVLTPSGNIDPTKTPAGAFGASPNSILAPLGNVFYLNGIGSAGKNGIPLGLVQNHWNDWGPRIGFAYDFTGSGKTVLRGGFGIMYEREQGNDMYDSGGNVPFSESVNFSNVALSNPNLSLATGAAPVSPIPVSSISGLMSTNYKNGASNQYSVGIQQKLGSDSVLSIAYVGNQNRHQYTRAETNLPPESELASLIGASSYTYDSAVPYVGFSSIFQFEGALNTHYNGLQVHLQSRLKRGLTFDGAFTWSRSIDPIHNNGNEDVGSSSNPYDLNYDMGPSSYDRTAIALFSLIYDIPLLRHSTNRPLKTVAGGWELSAIGTVETGTPLYIGLSGPQGSNAVQNGSNRPDLSGSVSYTKTYSQWFSGNFSTPALGDWGNLGNGVVRNPGRDNWNISLFKDFVISETRGSLIELRIESFNTLNHTQFSGVNSTYGAGGFGAVNSTWDPRVFQFALKVKF